MSRVAYLLIALTETIVGGQTGGKHLTEFVPFFFDGGKPVPSLTAFLRNGQSTTVPLPSELPDYLNILAVSQDGKRLFAKDLAFPRSNEGITQIEFDPPRYSTVPGTIGLGRIESLMLSSSGEFFIIGFLQGAARNVCAFVLDSKGQLRPMGPFASEVNCRTDTGPISPDGVRMISRSGKERCILNLRNGTKQLLKGIEAGGSATWSPNGSWLAFVDNGRRLTVVDSDDTSKRKHLGSISNGIPKWSPDSRYLLVEHSLLRCMPALYFQSLQIIELDTGRRQIVKGSECSISSGSVNWIAPSVVH